MNKTKLGVSVGLVGAALYLSGLVSIVPVVLIAGYVLLCESDEWLRKTAVKAVVVVITFAALFGAVSLLGSVYDMLSDIFTMFGSYLSISFFHGLIAFINDALGLLETLTLLALGFLALKQRDIPVEPLDKMLN